MKLLTDFKPSLIFSRTLATGGDTGSHHYISKAFDEFFPFALGGWSTGWYAGMPMLEFYFPFPYLLIWLVRSLTGYEIAFKLVTIAGTFALPAVAYFLFRMLDAPRLVASLAPAGAIAFLWIEGRGDENLLDIFGGFITSTLAGEFAYSLGLAFAVVTLAIMYRASRRCAERIPWGLVAAAGAILGIAALTHVLPLALIIVAAPALVVAPFTGNRWWVLWLRRTAIVAVTGILGMSIAAFWLLPSMTLRINTAPSVWINEFGVEWFFAPWFMPVLVVAVIGVGLAIWKRRPGALVLAWTGLGGLAAFLVTPYVSAFDPIVNGRFLPIYYLMVCLLAAWGLGEIANLIPGMWQSRRSEKTRPLWLLRAVVAILFAVGLAGSMVAQSAKVRFWAQHNYAGYDAQPGWPELQDLMATIDALPDGRVMWEYNADYSRFGTPRALENIPFFTNKDTMEGLLLEGSVSAQAHFWLQGLSSPTATGAVPGVQYPTMNAESGVALMRVFATKYFVAETDTVITEYAALDGVTEIARSGRFVIFEVSDTPLVSVPSVQPKFLDEGPGDWRDLTLEWLQDPALYSVPVTYGAIGRSETPDELAALGALQPITSISQAATSPKARVDGAGPVESNLDRNEVSFRTDRIGEPHIVAVSYYPNWQAEGAVGPFMVTPSLMLVFPTESDVRLVYRPSTVERVGQVISLVGIAVTISLGGYAWIRRRHDRPRAQKFLRPRGRGDGIS